MSVTKSTIKLRDYQVDISSRAAEVIKSRGIFLLIMQMRTGKTMTSLQVGNLIGAKNVLFLTKKKVIDNIKSDAEALGVNYDLTITNYDKIKNLKKEYDYVIVDELHSFGAFAKPSQRAVALKKICEGVNTLMLSGTPTPESYSQIYHPLWCVNYWPHKNFYHWAKDYVTVKEKFYYNKKINDYSHANKDKVMEAIKDISISYTQKQAGFSVEVTDKVEVIPMPEKVRASIHILRRDKILKTKSGGVVLADTAVKMQSKIHQICSGSVKTESGEVIAFEDFKARFIKEKYGNKKIAIYYKYIGELEILKRYFTNIADSDVDFNESSDKVYLSQMTSGREGINLSTADYLIMFNIDYSSLTYQQVRERIVTKDKTSKCEVVWVMCEGGIEQAIYEKVKNKEDFTLSHFVKLF